MTAEKRTLFFDVNDSLFKSSVDMLTVGAFLLAAGVYLNGATALLHAIVCVMSSAICEYIASKLILKKNTLGDLSAVSEGLFISLLIPACAPLWLGILAAAFSVLAVKLPFGGAKHSAFVPICAGVCFISICFPEYMFTYAAQTSKGMFITNEAFVSGTTLLDLLSQGKSISLNIFGSVALLSGTYPGAIGTTSMLLIIAGAVFIFIRAPKRIWVTLGYIISCAAFAFIFPRVNSGRISSVVLELSAGSLMFTACFLVNSFAFLPKTKKYGIIYGLVAGLICMLLRYFAKIPDTACFGVLLMNAVWPAVVRKEKISGKKSRKVLKNKSVQKRLTNQRSRTDEKE